MKRIAFLILAGCVITLLAVSCAKTSQPAEIEWMTDLDAALLKSQAENKPLMVDFMATWCPPCNAMEASTFNQPDVIRKAHRFITLRIDVDKQPDIANAYKSNAQKYGGIGIPNLLFLSPDQRTLAHPIGYMAPKRLTAIMDSVLTAIRSGK